MLVFSLLVDNQFPVTLLCSTRNDPCYQICDKERNNTAQYGDEHGIQATRSKKKKVKNGDSTEMYSFLQSFTKENWKGWQWEKMR